VTKLRLGIVGIGKHGLRYAKHAAEDVDAVELVAVCRRDAALGREIARRYRCDYVTDAHELIRRADIDAVVFATVPVLLEDLVVAAASRGREFSSRSPSPSTWRAGAASRAS
jgi:predicted dehydrogenase